MKNKKIKCDIYTRVSTTMQVDGYSLDAQKEKLKRRRGSVRKHLCERIGVV